MENVSFWKPLLNKTAAIVYAVVCKYVNITENHGFMWRNKQNNAVVVFISTTMCFYGFQTMNRKL